MFKLLINLLFIGILVITCSTSTPILAGNYSRNLCHTPGYSCIRIQSYDETWESLWPNPEKRRIVMRLNRMNTPLYRGLVIAVPNTLAKINHMDISPMPYYIKALGTKVIIVNTAKHAFGAYDSNGYLIHWGPVSTGKGWCDDVGPCNTPHGKFYVYAKGSSDCISRKFPIPEGGAPMPFCMFFYGGYALHGSDLPGYNASHGCIRLFYEDAEWLNRNFVQVGKKGTKVIVM